MTRANISVEKLLDAGYEPFEFGDYTMEQGVKDIKNGCQVRLDPRYGGYMVAVVIVKNGCHEYAKEMCTRAMTASEKEKFADKMSEQKKHDEKVSARIHARHRARMGR